MGGLIALGIKIKMNNVVKNPCTAIFTGPTGCGKTKLMLDLLQNEYRHHFENIIILCSTLRWNETYRDRKFLWNDDYIFLIVPKEKLIQWIEKLSDMLAGEETLFIVDDMIADETINKRRTPLLELAISGRHRKHSLWFLTQVYVAVPKDLRRQCKMLFTWYPKERSDMKLIDEETNLIDDWKPIKVALKESKHACLFIRLESPLEYQIIQ